MSANNLWGESNTREFYNWANFVREKELKKRGLQLTPQGTNYANNVNSPEAKQVTSQLLDIIQSSRTITVENLYSKLPNNLLQNTSIKNLLMQLYFGDNLTIQGKRTNRNEDETNFSLTFVKKAKPTPPPVREVHPNARHQEKSNIEDMYDNAWRASGRKLDFDKKPKETLNTSLKNTPSESPSYVTPELNKTVDVRETFKKDPPKITKQVITPVTINAPSVKEEKAKPMPNLNYGNFVTPEPKPEPIKDPEMTLNLTQYKPEPKKVIVDDKTFYGVSAFELYQLEAFTEDSIVFEKNVNKNDLRVAKDLIRVNADIKYLETRDMHLNIFVRILYFLSFFILVGIFIFIARHKNKVRKNARKEYFKKVKKTEYKDYKKEFKSKYPKIIEY